MRRHAYVLLLAAFAGCARVDVEAEKTALLTVDREWSQTTKDMDKFMSYWATDANAYPPGAPMASGTDAIRKTLSDMFSAPGFSLSWMATKAVVAASGDIGYTTGTYEAAMAGATEKGKYVTTWKKQDGAWKVTEDIRRSRSPSSSDCRCRPATRSRHTGIPVSRTSPSSRAPWPSVWAKRSTRAR
jgi:ketosteroid isomerase-like protein